MKIAYVTAGAAGMFCGACIHDNTLAAALADQGHDVPLIPTYTPTRTDEANVSLPRVFFGGINVYLQQQFALFRHTPWWLDRLLDAPVLLRWVSRFAASTNPAELGAFAVSMLRGEQGNQQKELRKLIHWLKNDVKPHVVYLTNAMLVGFARNIKRELDVPVVCGLPGEDLFLDGLPEPFGSEARSLLRERASDADGYVAMSFYYADLMADYLAVPRDRIHVVWPGLNLEGRNSEEDSDHTVPDTEYAIRNTSVATASRLITIGYFARIAPEKGLHLLAEAYRILRQMPEIGPTRLWVAGYLGANDRPYLEKIQHDLAEWGLTDQFEYAGSLDRKGKLEFLRGLDLFSVPTIYRDPKGLSVLEALASGVPVVQPAHGAFPELVNATGGGLLVKPADPQALAEGLARLVRDPLLREQLSRQGRESVVKDFTDTRMADQTVEVLRKYVKKPIFGSSQRVTESAG